MLREEIIQSQVKCLLSHLCEVQLYLKKISLILLNFLNNVLGTESNKQPSMFVFDTKLTLLRKN